MPDRIIIRGTNAYDGEYEFDASTLSNRELHLIKRLSGVRAGELVEALLAGDSDMLVALAAVAITRTGKPLMEDLLWDAEAGTITYEGETVEEADEVPPASSGDSPSELVASGGSSGTSGQNGSESNPSGPSPTTAASSPVSATSSPQGSAT